MKLLVKLESGGDTIFFDVMAIQVISIPNQFGPTPNSTCTILMQGGASLNVPRSLAIELVGRLNDINVAQTQDPISNQ